MQFEYNLNTRNSYSYEAYRAMIDELLSQGKTTGDNHSEVMLGHSTMNVARMKRLEKRGKINDELKEVVQRLAPQKWLVITEAWCGDAAQNLPWIHHLAQLNKDIELSLILRDENLDIMDQFLTNGGRSIPKLIGLSADNEILFSWGPRPQLMQETYTTMKAAGMEYAEISETIHRMYAKNNGKAFQDELLTLLR